MRVKPGDIVLTNFPMHDGRNLLHPALVLNVEESLSGRTVVRCAYGSSKKTEGLMPTEFVISERDGRAFAVSGLRKTTRFDLRITARFCSSNVRVIGVLHSCLYASFKEAARSLPD